MYPIKIYRSETKKKYDAAVTDAADGGMISMCRPPFQATQKIQSRIRALQGEGDGLDCENCSNFKLI